MGYIVSLIGGRCDWLGHFVLICSPAGGRAIARCVSGMLSAWAVVLEGPGLLSARCRVALAVECETRHGDSGGSGGSIVLWWFWVVSSLCFTRLRSFPRAARGGSLSIYICPNYYLVSA
jgi:hypothetical protein